MDVFLFVCPKCHFLCLDVIYNLTELSELKFNYLLNFFIGKVSSVQIVVGVVCSWLVCVSMYVLWASLPEIKA